jgi:RNA polymerase sigma factor (sigma-70 family)
MGQGRSIGMAHHEKALFQAGRLGDLSDAALLERSIGKGGDPAIRETAFSALVERHGPMVLRVCEAVGGNFQDAEDAFQATFLVLAREAPRLTIRDSLGPWLHAVAVRISLYALRARARHLSHERTWASQAPARLFAEPGAQDRLEREEAICMVQTEIARLPNRLRACVVLCDLQGLTYAQAARRLDLPLGTVQSRLARARNRLRESLTRRGLSPGKPVGQDTLAGIQLPGVAIGMRLHFIERTARICLEFAANTKLASGLVSSSTTALVKGGIDMLLWSKLKQGVLGLAFCLLVGGLAVHSQTGGRDRFDPQSSRQEVFPSAQSVPAQKPALEIVAPSEVQAFGGRGTLLIYDLDSDGERIAAGPMKPQVSGKVKTTWKEVEREYHWAVITGVLDHHAIQESANRSGAGDANSPYFYLRVELARQTRNPDGTWSSWTAVDSDANFRVLDNLPEEDEELIEVRSQNLVDPLPHLKTGKWQGVNVEHLSRKRADGPQSVVLPDFQFRVGGAPTPPRPLPPELMLRSFDFTVVPGQTYRYRVRVVARSGIQSGRGGAKRGKWSGPTNDVTVQ